MDKERFTKAQKLIEQFKLDINFKKRLKKEYFGDFHYKGIDNAYIEWISHGKDYIHDQDYIYLVVTVDKKTSYFNLQGEQFIDLWFDYAQNVFCGALAKVIIGGKRNMLKTDFTLLWDKPLDEWFDEIYSENASDDFSIVSIGNKKNIFIYDPISGALCYDAPLSEWFDSIKRMNVGSRQLFKVSKLDPKTNKPRFNLMPKKKKSKLIWDKPVEQWFKDINLTYDEQSGKKNVVLAKHSDNQWKEYNIGNNLKLCSVNGNE